VVMVLWRTVSLLSGPAPAGDSASRQEALNFFFLSTQVARLKTKAAVLSKLLVLHESTIFSVGH
jgi:hypothetical protein